MPTKSEIESFLTATFPRSSFTIESVGNRGATVRREIGEAELRPGGTVSGPTLMATADFALYIAIFGEVGIVPMAVTTNLNINFLRKPSANAAIVAVCKLMKVGKSLAVGEVSLYSEGDDDPVAHVVGTYSIPRDAQQQAKA
jgi:acyl-coenzyme A thioesterase PaaI-like protein